MLEAPFLVSAVSSAIQLFLHELFLPFGAELSGPVAVYYLPLFPLTGFIMLSNVPTELNICNK